MSCLYGFDFFFFLVSLSVFLSYVMTRGPVTPSGYASGCVCSIFGFSLGVLVAACRRDTWAFDSFWYAPVVWVRTCLCLLLSASLFSLLFHSVLMRVPPLVFPLFLLSVVSRFFVPTLFVLYVIT